MQCSRLRMDSLMRAVLNFNRNLPPLIHQNFFYNQLVSSCSSVYHKDFLPVVIDHTQQLFDGYNTTADTLCGQNVAPNYARFNNYPSGRTSEPEIHRVKEHYQRHHRVLFYFTSNNRIPSVTASFIRLIVSYEYIKWKQREYYC